jgi:KDO transferase-3
MSSEDHQSVSSETRGNVRRRAGKLSAGCRRASSTFFKLIYRYTHSRAFRHNERFASGVTLERDAAGRLCGMRLRGREVACANGLPLSVRGQAVCHLIASGPSVKTIDYSRMGMPNTMGVNGAIALRDQYDVRFNYYCIVDTGFVRNRPDLVERVLAEPLTLFATPLVIWHIAQQFHLEHVRCRIFLIDDMQFPAGRRAIDTSELRAAYAEASLALIDASRPLGFSLDIRHGVFDGRTVAYAGLQVLASLGFGRIALHGVDLINAGRTPRFYESGADMQPCHLDADFHEFIEPSFRAASRLLARRGVKVLNLSMQSALSADIFPKVNWRTFAQEQARDADHSVA